MLIELKDVNKTYQGAQPLHVLKGIDLTIGKGEFVRLWERRDQANPRF